MRLRDLVDESAVMVNLASRNKEQCLAELVERLALNGRIPDRGRALEALWRREAQGSTGIGRGIAVPHAKCGGVLSLTMAVGVSVRGMDFDAVDGAPVYLVFLLLARSDDPGPHIRALAEIGRLAQTPDFCRKAFAVRSAGEFLDLLDSEEKPAVTGGFYA